MDEPERTHRPGLTHERAVLLVILLLAAVSLGWLGYYVKWKNERNGMRAWIDAHSVGGAIGYQMEPRPPLPWMLSLLGETPVETLFIAHSSLSFGGPAPDGYRRVVQTLTALFPETQIVDLSDGSFDATGTDATTPAPETQ
jgi:hypothetical protein